MMWLKKRRSRPNRREQTSLKPRFRSLRAESLEPRMLLSGADYGFAFRLGSTYPDSGGAIATDSAGNIYVVGLAGGKINYNPGGSANLAGDAFIAKYTPNGSFVWAHTITGDIQYEGVDICVGPDDNFVYVTGGFAGTVNFNLGSGPSANLHSDKAGAFVLKVTSGGSLEWARAFPGTVQYGTDGTGIAVDAAGNVYTTGFFSDTVDFDPADGPSHVHNMISPRFGDKPSKDIYVSKLDEHGDFVWAKQVSGNWDTGSEWDSGDQGLDIALDSDANVYTTGTFRGKDVDFDPDRNSQYLVTTSGPWDHSAYYNDAFVWKLDTDGDFVWARRLGGPAEGQSIALDGGGNVYTAGILNGDGAYFRVGNNVGSQVHAIQSATGQYGARTVFVSRLNSDGDFVWASGIGSFPYGENPSYTDPHVPLGLDGRKSVYVAGNFRGQNIDFDPDLAKTAYLSSAGGTDIFVSRLDDQTGGLVSVDQIGGASDDLVLGLAVGPGSTVYTTGSFKGTVDFDPGDGTHTLTASGSYEDAFVSKLQYYHVSQLTLSAGSSLPFGELIATSDTPLDTSSPLTARFSDDNGYTVDVPVASSTADTATLVVPPYVDPTTGQITTGTVQVELVQGGRVVGAAAAPLEILDLLDSSLPTGTITLGYLRGALEEARAQQDAIRWTILDTADNNATLSALANRLDWLVSQVQDIVNTPSQTANFGTVDAKDIILDSAAVAQMDQLLRTIISGEAALDTLSGEMMGAMAESQSTGTRITAAQEIDEKLSGGQDPGAASWSHYSNVSRTSSESLDDELWDRVSMCEIRTGSALIGIGLAPLAAGGGPTLAAAAILGGPAVGAGLVLLAGGLLIQADLQQPGTIDDVLDDTKKALDAATQTMTQLVTAAQGTILGLAQDVKSSFAAIQAAASVRPSNEVRVVPVNSPTTYEDPSKTSAVFNVWLTDQPSDTVTITMNVSDETEGTITSGSVITFTPSNWATRQAFIAGVDDDFADGDKQYDLVATVLGGTSSGYSNQEIRRQLVNVDNEPELTISIQGTSVTEGAAGTTTMATLPVTLSGKSEQPITFKYQTVQASAKERVDYKKVPWTTKTIPAGTDNTSVSVTVLGNDSDDAVDPRSFYVSILPVSEITAVHPQAEVQIVDDDVVGVIVEPLDSQTSWKGETGKFRVKLTSKPTANVRIDLALDDKTEGKVLSSKLTFTSGNWNKWKTVTVKGLPDGIDDGNVEYHVNTANTISTDPNYNGLDVPDVTMWNDCNDAKPGVTLEVLDSQTSWEGDTGSFRVRLNKMPADDVTIRLSSSNTNEGTVEPTEFFFTTDDWNEWKTATVTGQPNGKLEGTVTYKIVTLATTSADPKYNRLSVADVTMVNVCGPRPPGVALEVLDDQTSWQGDTGKFRARLTSKPAANVTILLVSDHATEGKIISPNFVFTKSNWSTWQTATVKGQPDGEQDVLHPYTILTSGTISTDPNYSGLDVRDVDMVNHCDDPPQPGAWTVWVNDQSDCYNVIDDERPHQIDTGAGKKVGTYKNDQFVSLFCVDAITQIWDWCWWKYTYNGQEYKEYSNGLELSGSVLKNGVTVYIYDYEPLRAAGGAAVGVSQFDTLSAEALRPLWQQALALWRTAGLENASLDRLARTEVRIVDLSGDVIGAASRDTVLLDRDAAGYGWFIDPTPRTSEEFLSTSATSFRAPAKSPAARRMDLLTTLSHEIGHVLGLRDLDASQSPDDLMAGILGPGQRRVLSPAAVDGALALQ